MPWIQYTRYVVVTDLHMGKFKDVRNKDNLEELTWVYQGTMKRMRGYAGRHTSNITIDARKLQGRPRESNCVYILEQTVER